MKKIVLAAAFIALYMNVFGQSRLKEFRIEKKYLNIPVEQKREKQSVEFFLNGTRLTYGDINIADNKTDFWVFLDMSNFMGQKLKISFSESVTGINQIYQSDQFAGEDSVYCEKFRPQLHFSSRRGWNNDPNGLVYFEGEYHLFYQHNPFGISPGNPHWGHAVSKDLLHWEELPIALYPDEMGFMFSGSAVVDFNNSAGFKTGKEKTLVAFYTADWSEDADGIKEQQCLAYSNDRGRTFTKYDKNPVIPAHQRFKNMHERDPKVFWYEPGEHWVMILFEGMYNCIYTSLNLKDWEYQSYIDAGFIECPELFELPVDGNMNNKKWVVHDVHGKYLIGNFNGKEFIPETEMLRFNVGYSTGGMMASQTYNNTPDGRRIQIGWGRAEHPGMPFNQMMCFPAELKLKNTKAGVRLFLSPISEIENLYAKSYSFKNLILGKDDINSKLQNIKSCQLHIKVSFELGNCNQFGININGYDILYNVPLNTLNGHFLPLEGKKIKLEIIADRTSIEIFANEGIMFQHVPHVSDPENLKTSFSFREDGYNKNPYTWIRELEINELKSVWKQ